jgi:hypothetical protein
VYKNTADVEAGKGLYDDITSVDSWWGTTVREVLVHMQLLEVLLHGRTSVSQNLGPVKMNLQIREIHKNTADVEAGKGLYDDITSVDSWWGTTVREVVLKTLNQTLESRFILFQADLVTLKNGIGLYKDLTWDLQKLHVYKNTADVEAGKGLYDDITSVDSWWGTTLESRFILFQADLVTLKNGIGLYKDLTWDLVLQNLSRV